MLNQSNCNLLIIDIQEKLLNASFNKEIVEKKSIILKKASEILNIPVIVTEQYPQGLGESIGDLKINAKTFIKKDFNALNDESLLSELKKENRNQIIIFGIETHICVYQTVSALLKEGFDVNVVSDACGSRSEIEYKAGLEYMKTIGAKIKTTEMIIFELLKSANHPNFKEIQKLIK